MAVADRSIDPRILDSARTEFLASGFEKASLKTICEGAGVTTGALYKRYKGKEDLFSAVVEQTVADLYEVAHARGDKDPAAMSDQELIKAWDMDGADMMWWFRFLYDRRDDFYLLLSCSQGTRYANFPHDWVELLTKATSAYLAEAQRRGLCRNDVEPAELHILLSLSGPRSTNPSSTTLPGSRSRPTAGSSAACSTGMERCIFRNRESLSRRRGFSPVIS